MEKRICTKVKTLAIIVAVLIFTGCGGSGSGSGTLLSTTGTCIYSGISQLVYPAPGATSVPDAPAQIVFAVTRLFPYSWQAVVTSDSNPNNAASGTAAFFQQIQPSAVPTPSAAVTISNPYYESAAMNATFVRGTYYVFLKDSVYICIPALAGSFSTQ